MTQNISGFGETTNIKASNTFSNGFNFNEYADDADPMDSPDYTVADAGFGLNGHMVFWVKPQGIEVVYNMLPLTPGDINLSILTEANRAGLGKTSAGDIITLVHTYPTGQIITLNNGVIITGNLVSSTASNGRLKTHLYRFRFENMDKSNVPTAAA
jgi:hypothetical protein